MEQAIRDFHRQFAWKPEIRGSTSKRGLPVEPLGVRTFILNGMGGSHLAADLLHTYQPEIDLSVFSDYGLPPLPSARLSQTLCIASSFSGNTEEAIDFAEQARAKKLSIAVIAKGGTLLELARKHKLPHVILPPVKIQPRSGLGYQMLALAALIGDAKLQDELAALASVLKPDELEEKGETLASVLRGKVPVVYASTRNQAVAYNWKIKFNETGKIPAFYNVFPELNHNEMTGFSAEGGPASGGDISKEAAKLSETFHFIFLTDSEDYPQNQKRMKVTRKLYEERGLSVTEVPLENTPPPTGNRRSAPLDRGDTTPTFAPTTPSRELDTPPRAGGAGGIPITSGDSRLEKIFTSLLIADWTALHLSKIYGTEAEQVPMVEQFKKLIA